MLKRWAFQQSGSSLELDLDNRLNGNQDHLSKPAWSSETDLNASSHPKGHSFLCDRGGAPLCFRRSISNSTERMAKIVQDIKEVNKSLGNLGSSVKSFSSMSSSDEGDIPPEIYYQTQLELKKAQVAHGEVKAVLSHVNSAWTIQETDIRMRACQLRRESFKFQKLSPEAVERINAQRELEHRWTSFSFDGKL